MLIPIKRLYLVAGFDGPDHERTVAAVQRLYTGNDRKFLTRVYPSRPDKQVGYLRALVQDAVKLIFGPDGATNFCRRMDQPCSLDQDRGREKLKTCEAGKGQLAACGRTRPQLLIVICADRLYDEVFEHLGRGALIFRLGETTLPDVPAFKALVDRFEPTAAHVNDVISNRSRSLYAPLVPDRNFQRIAGQAIAVDAQANASAFGEVMQTFHKALYRGDFLNPKRGIRGAYMLDDQTAFQEDRFHNTVQNIGQESRKDGFHLLNAYHVYGVKADPGFHFDVMNAAGSSIGKTFEDVLDGRTAGRTETHLNITPCDRLV